MTYQLTHNWTYYADTVNPRTSNTGLTTRPEFVNEISSTPPPSPFFCTHTDVYTYSMYIVPLTYSNLMMAS